MAFNETEITSTRKLGKRLQQFNDQDCGDLHLERIGVDEDGTVWMLAQRSSFSPSE